MADFFPTFTGGFTLKSKANPEEIYCILLQDLFRSSVRIIEAAITAPLFIYRTFLNSLKRISSLLQYTVETDIYIIEQEIIKALAFDDIDLLKNNSDFCNVLRQCEALLNIILSPDNKLLGLTAEQKELVLTNEQQFEDLVCKQSLRNLFENYTDSLLADFDEQLDRLEDILNSYKIIDLIDKYLQNIQDTGILDLIDDLNKFNNCAFSLCDVSTMSENYKNDLAEKLGLEEQNGTWFVNFDEFINEIIEKQEELNRRINDIRLIIERRRVPRGVPVDQIAR